MTKEQTIKAIKKAVNDMRKYYNGVCGYVHINGIHVTFLDIHNKPMLFFDFCDETLFIWNGSPANWQSNIVMSIQYSNIKEIF